MKVGKRTKNRVA